MFNSNESVGSWTPQQVLEYVKNNLKDDELAAITKKINQPANVTAQPTADSQVPIWNSSANQWVGGSVGTASLADGSVTSAKIADGTIVNADVNNAAAISYSKLNLANSIVTGDIVNGTIVDADISASAGIQVSKFEVDFTPLIAGDVIGIPVATSGQIDLAVMATANTTYDAAALPADMGSQATTLQFRLVSLLRTTTAGAGPCTGNSASVTASRFASGAGPPGAVVMITNNHNFNPNAGLQNNMVDSGWVNAGNETAQGVNINSTYGFITSRPTGQFIATLFMRAA